MAARIKATQVFSNWLNGLRDVQGRARIQARIDRLAAGNPGQHRNLKRGVSELKVDVGSGYRVYYTYRQGTLIILLCGGDKSTQDKDIRMAYRMVGELEI